MGTSNWQNIPFCINAIRRIQPNKILDVGFGFGRWAMICREFLELWQGRTNIEDWKLQIDGVEIFNANIEEYHKFFYSNIFNEDIFGYLQKADTNYDLIILGDVLEHFERSKANELLDLCLERADYIILNIPLGKNWQQGILYNNPYECHLSFWTKRDIKRRNCIYYKIFKDYAGRSFGSFILYNKYTTILFTRKIVMKFKFKADNYPYIKSIVKKVLFNSK